MTDIEKCKIIIADLFESERLRPRSQEQQRMLGDSLTTIEIDAQKQFNRLNEGEDIFTILPHFFKRYNENDKTEEKKV